MSSDLILLITCIKDKNSFKEVLKIEDGLNTSFSDNFMYYQESGVLEFYKKLINKPIDFIIAVEIINNVRLLKPLIPDLEGFDE